MIPVLVSFGVVVGSICGVALALCAAVLPGWCTLGKIRAILLASLIAYWAIRLSVPSIFLAGWGGAFVSMIVTSLSIAAILSTYTSGVASGDEEPREV